MEDTLSQKLSEHEQYLLELTLAFVSTRAPRGFDETETEIEYVLHQYDYFQMEARHRLEELAKSYSIAEFLPEYWDWKPDPDISYKPIDAGHQVRKIEDTSRFTYWNFLKQVSIVMPRDINKRLEIMGGRKIFTDKSRENLDLPTLKEVCRYLRESYPDAILEQFCPVTFRAPRQSRNASVPWVSLLLSMLHKEQEYPDTEVRQLPEEAPAAAAPPENAGRYAENPRRDWFRTHYEDMLFLMESVAGVHASSSVFGQSLGRNIEILKREPARISGYVLERRVHSGTHYQYKAYSGILPSDTDIGWETKDWNWFREENRPFAAVSIFRPAMGGNALLRIIPPEKERLGRAGEGRYAALFPADGVFLIHAYESQVLRRL